MSLDILGPASALNSVTTRPAQATTYGATRTWFKNCTSLTTQDGTEITNDWLNNILAQFRTLFDGTGIVEDNGDDMTLRAVQSLGIRYGVDTSGTADQINVTFTPPIVAYGVPLTLAVLVANDCDGSAVNINCNALGNVSVLDAAGNNPKPQAIKAGGLHFFEYNGTSSKFQLMNPYTPSAPGSPSTTKAPKLIGIMASQGGMVVPPETPTNFNFPTTNQNNLWGTSTWDGTTLTIGAGEAGIWFCSFEMGFGPSQNLGASYIQAVVTLNSTGDALVGSSPGDGNTSLAATANGCGCSGMVKVNVGDQIRFNGYQQGGSTTGTATATMHAFLFSAY